MHVLRFTDHTLQQRNSLCTWEFSMKIMRLYLNLMKVSISIYLDAIANSDEIFFKVFTVIVEMG